MEREAHLALMKLSNKCNANLHVLCVTLVTLRDRASELDLTATPSSMNVVIEVHQFTSQKWLILRL